MKIQFTGEKISRTTAITSVTEASTMTLTLLRIL